MDRAGERIERTDLDEVLPSQFNKLLGFEIGDPELTGPEGKVHAAMQTTSTERELERVLFGETDNFKTVNQMLERHTSNCDSCAGRINRIFDKIERRPKRQAY